MRVGIFLPSLNGGGAERVMVTLANAIAARGFSVDLVLASATGPYLKDVSPAVRLVDLKAGRVIKALLPLARYLHRERPVALLSAMGHANVVALLVRKLARASVRVVVSERNTISVEHSLARGMPARLSFALVRLLYPTADGICTVSQAASNDLAAFAGLAKDRVQTIYNPFDLECIARRAAEPLDHPWLAASQCPVVLAIGRLTEQKDYPTLLKAFARLQKQQPVRLVILGEGEQRPALEALVHELGLSDAVHLPGFVPNPMAWSARCSLFVLSSRWEGLPGVLIEAMACGAPVVSTNCPSGPDEILEGGRWGKLVPVGDVEALASAMAEVLITPGEQLPDVRLRAADFEQERAVDAYLRILGLPLQAPAARTPESHGVLA